jgi:hypothetical protein
LPLQVPAAAQALLQGLTADEEARQASKRAAREALLQASTGPQLLRRRSSRQAAEAAARKLAEAAGSGGYLIVEPSCMLKQLQQL